MTFFIIKLQESSSQAYNIPFYNIKSPKSDNLSLFTSNISRFKIIQLPSVNVYLKHHRQVFSRSYII